MSVNKATLLGNVGRDPEIKYLGEKMENGVPVRVAQFSLATTERRKNASGQVEENTEWHNIVAWRKLAEIAEKFVKKGTSLYIEGRIRTRSYTDKSGATKYRTEIVADTMQLLGKKDEQEARTTTGWKGGPAQAQQPTPMPPVQGVPPEAYFQEQPDDLPF